MVRHSLGQTNKKITKNQGGMSVSRKSLIASPIWMVIFYLTAIAFAEALTNLWAPLAGVTFHGLILVGLLSHASFITPNAQRRFYLSLALVPLLRLISLSLPLRMFPTIYWYLLVGILLFIGLDIVVRLGNLNHKMLGLVGRDIPRQLLIGSSGLVLGLIGYFILKPAPLINNYSWVDIWMAGIILLVFTGLLEELIFRGLLLYTSSRILGRVGIIYVALINALLHLGYHSTLNIFFTFGVALYFGIVTLRTGSILGVSLSHGLANICLYLVLPFLFLTPTNVYLVSSDIAEPGRIIIQSMQSQYRITPSFSGGFLAESTAFTPTPTEKVPPTNTPTFPPVPTLTSVEALPAYSASPAVCGPLSGWIPYTVIEGDTLYGLGQNYQISIDAIRAANCLKDGEWIIAGQLIFLPAISPAQTASQIPPQTTNKPSPEPTTLSNTDAPLPISTSTTTTQPSSTGTPASTHPAETPTPVPPWDTPTPAPTIDRLTPTAILPTLPP
jgi:membrane protease YdiL (CAAX protease family)